MQNFGETAKSIMVLLKKVHVISQLVRILPNCNRGIIDSSAWTYFERTPTIAMILTIGTLRSNDADDNKNVKKTMGLISKTTTSHVHHNFLYISFPFLHDYDVKMPNFPFYGGRKQATTKIYFSFWAWICSLEIQLQEGSPTIDKASG